MRFLVEPWEKARAHANLEKMRLLAVFAVSAALSGSGCWDLDGFSDGESTSSSGLTLRTQAAVEGTEVSSFVLSPPGPAHVGDLLFYVIAVTGGGEVVTPEGFTLVDSIENRCVPAVIWIFSRAATQAGVAQRFEMKAVADNVEATLLVIGGVDPIVRAHAAKAVDVASTTFQADPITVAENDAPAHLLFTALFAGNTPPTGATALTSNGAAAFSTLAAPTAGSLTPPAMTVDKSCGTVITTVLKDR